MFTYDPITAARCHQHGTRCGERSRVPLPMGHDL